MSRHRPAPPRGGALIASALGCAAAARAGTPLHASGRVELIGDNGNRGIGSSTHRPKVELKADLLHVAGLFAEVERARE